MPPKIDVTVYTIISPLGNDRVTAVMLKVLQPFSDAAVNSSIEKLNHELKLRDETVWQTAKGYC
jgi:hypothetical protein